MASSLLTYDVLATDYDGTLAEDGRVTKGTLDRMQRAREAGIHLIMVTGRELSDLFNTFEYPELFERIVAENGAVLYDPVSKTADALAPPPPPQLIERLTQASVPLSVGHSILATVAPHEHPVLAAIRDLGLEWHVIFNKGSVMALPTEVTKATGLSRALEALGLRAERTIGIGDAENDHAFLHMCGLAVAVANALPAVKESADLVTTGVAGDGVSELIGQWLDGALNDRHRGKT